MSDGVGAGVSDDLQHRFKQRLTPRGAARTRARLGGRGTSRAAENRGGDRLFSHRYKRTKDWYVCTRDLFARAAIPSININTVLRSMRSHICVAQLNDSATLQAWEPRAPTGDRKSVV